MRLPVYSQDPDNSSKNGNYVFLKDALHDVLTSMRMTELPESQ
jgi:hypothetical protein